MREAMYHAEVGDDVYQEDPTVRRLQEATAEKLGKEAALFVTSGTMGNLVALLTHCRRGDEAIMGDNSHTFIYECGGASVLGGISMHTVPNLADGSMDPAQIEWAIRGDNVHFPRTRLLCLENTHNRCGGTVLSYEQMHRQIEVAKKYGLAIHLDGARVFNAAIALGVKMADLVAECDSVQLCFSKGLAAPVGSALCGSKAFIDEALRNRKVVGGGMRQAGVLAAAALVGLEQMVDRLAEDHANARMLAEGMLDIRGVNVDMNLVQSNMVMFTLNSDKPQEQVLQELAAEGLRVSSMDSLHLRAVTHLGIGEAEIKQALCIMARVLGGRKAGAV